MDATTLEPLPPFTTIGLAEKWAIDKAMKNPLSGYLGGIRKGGYWVERLQHEWCATFKCKHAIACNSATSGLLAACMAIGIGPGDIVWTTALSMSATAACAKVLGASIVFIDIETIRFSLNMNNFGSGERPKCIIVTNLFGHPAYLSSMRGWCDSNNVMMVEDNAQSPFAMESGRFAGTVGHIGVFSLNVHKHIQCGEGGVIVTDSDELAIRLADSINHGELSDHHNLGLNLRMTEPTAAIAVAQLAKGPQIIENRREFAQELTEMFRYAPFVTPPSEDVDCKHVYYCWAGRVTNGKRWIFHDKLCKRGFPMMVGYRPLNRMFYIPFNIQPPRRFAAGYRQMEHQSCPVAEKMDDAELILFEVCRYDPSKKQRLKMMEIIKRVAGEMDEDS